MNNSHLDGCFYRKKNGKKCFLNIKHHLTRNKKKYFHSIYHHETHQIVFWLEGNEPRARVVV